MTHRQQVGGALHGHQPRDLRHPQGVAFLAFGLVRSAVLGLARLAGLAFVPIGPWIFLAVATLLVGVGLLLAGRHGAALLARPGYPRRLLAACFRAGEPIPLKVNAA